MESIEEFLKIELGSGSGYGDGSGSGYGSGYGDGDGSGSGSGYGYGDGYGDGSGSGYGDGSGSGYGSGYGDGDGSGSGSGYGYGDGYGDGSGSGYGYGDGIKTFNNFEIYIIDDIPTIIKQARNNIAKGFILENDLTLTPCYIVKGHNYFSHGKTVKKAFEDLQNKIFENINPEEAIELFLKEFADLDKKYPAKAFYVWHNRLTGSCEAGRNSFVKNGGYDLEKDTFTVLEFIEITENAYGGDIIKQLKNRIKE